VRAFVRRVKRATTLGDLNRYTTRFLDDYEEPAFARDRPCPRVVPVERLRTARRPPPLHGGW